MDGPVQTGRFGQYVRYLHGSGWNDPDLQKRFLALPYKKILFVGHKDMVLNEECIYVPGFEKEASLPDMSGWADFKGHRYYEKYFDVVGWLNEN